MRKTLCWRQTRLGVWYPTLDGVDAFWQIWKLYGFTFSTAPVFECWKDVQNWCAERGLSAEKEMVRV